LVIKKQIESRVLELGLVLIFRLKVINPIESNIMMIMQTLITSCVNKKSNHRYCQRFNGRRFYFGTMMVYKGDADGMVSGAAHTTQHTILPAFSLKLN
jgi:phosphate acetyltransferase